MESEENELTQTKAALLRVEREMEKLREEISEMRGDIHSGECNALGFKPSTFMAMSYSAALTWVANVLSPEMMKKMEKYPNFFEFRSVVGGAKSVGLKTCSKFNRGEECVNMWHVHTRPKKNGATGYRKELRLHCCPLCMETLDTMACHSIMTCPWLKEDTWKMVESKN